MRGTLHDEEESDCNARLTRNLDNEKEEIKNVTVIWDYHQNRSYLDFH